jgi:hypothetical protein
MTLPECILLALVITLVVLWIGERWPGGGDF